MPSSSVQFKDFVLDIKCDAPEQEWVAVEVSRVGRDDADSEGRRYTTKFKLSELDGLATKVEGLISESAAPERLAALPPPQTDRSFEKKVEPIGGTLFDKLFPQDSLIRNKLERDFDSTMRLRLRVSTLLADIPWEILWAPKDTLKGLIEEGGFLSQETSVVRTPGATGGAEEAHPTDPPLNLLLVADSPSPREQRLLDAQAQRIEEELQESGNIKVYRLEMTDRDETTLEAIHRYLTMRDWDAPIHILHFMGHGYYDADESPPVGRLLMTHRTGDGPEEVAFDEKAVADTIKDGLDNGLRLVVLNGCETGRGRIHFSGVAQALLNEGVPAVLAMQYSISDHLARHLAAHFYEGLAQNRSIDKAVRHVRRYLCNHPFRTLEWITPVLFLRGDGELWTFAADDELLNKLVATLDQGGFVDQQNIYKIIMQLGEEVLEELVKTVVTRQGIDKLAVRDLGSQPVPENVSNQIAQVMAAQGEVAARGIPPTPQTLYELGRLAAYDRNYDAALRYFRQATQADQEYLDAFQAIVWLQQSRAMHDIQAGNYDAASSKLADAREAAMHTDPLDPQALALRGYIAKTLAQIAHARGDQAEEQKHYEEAARFFKHVVHLDPSNAGAHNGLGNVEHARGNLDGAIAAYSRAIELSPRYTAAYHDLALAYEGKMEVDPAQESEWCQKALQMWQRAYHLAPNDPGFSKDDILRIGRSILELEGRCG